jgi:opacity protein-like surface antigen
MRNILKVSILLATLFSSQLFAESNQTVTTETESAKSIVKDLASDVSSKVSSFLKTPFYKRFYVELSSGVKNIVEHNREKRADDSNGSDLALVGSFALGYMEEDGDRHSIHYTFSTDPRYDENIYSYGYNYQLTTKIVSKYNLTPFVLMGLEVGSQSFSDEDLEKYEISDDKIKFFGIVLGTGLYYTFNFDKSYISALDLGLSYQFRYRGTDVIEYKSLENQTTKDSTKDHSFLISLGYRF